MTNLSSTTPYVQEEDPDHVWVAISTEHIRSGTSAKGFASQKGLLESTVKESLRTSSLARKLAGCNEDAMLTLRAATPSAIRKMYDAVQAAPDLKAPVEKLLTRRDGLSRREAVEAALEMTRGRAPGQIRAPRPCGKYGKAIALRAACEAMGIGWRPIVGPRDKSYGIAGTIANASDETVTVMTLVNPERRARHGTRDQAQRLATASAIHGMPNDDIIIVVPSDWPLATALGDDIASKPTGRSRKVRLILSGRVKDRP